MKKYICVDRNTQVVCINVAKRENGVNDALTRAAGLSDKVRGKNTRRYTAIHTSEHRRFFFFQEMWCDVTWCDCWRLLRSMWKMYMKIFRALEQFVSYCVSCMFFPEVKSETQTHTRTKSRAVSTLPVLCRMWTFCEMLWNKCSCSLFTLQGLTGRTLVYSYIHVPFLYPPRVFLLKMRCFHFFLHSQPSNLSRSDAIFAPRGSLRI